VIFATICPDEGGGSEPFPAKGGGCESGSPAVSRGGFAANLPAGTYRLGIPARDVQCDATVAEWDPGQEAIVSTIPGKTLAKTGGPRLSVIAAGVFFAGSGFECLCRTAGAGGL
jgi:hypothetical protein